MILITGTVGTENSFDGLLVFALQLKTAGYPVGLDQALVPEKMSIYQKYQVARILVDPAESMISRVLFVASGEVPSEALTSLRKYRFPSEVEVAVIGQFSSAMERDDLKDRFDTALGRDALMVNLSDLRGKPIHPSTIFPLVGGPAAATLSSRSFQRLTVILSPDLRFDAGAIRELSRIGLSSNFSLLVVLAQGLRKEVEASQFGALPMVDHTEFSPGTIALQSDIVAFHGPGFPGARMLGVACDVIQREGTVIDCTAGSTLNSSGLPSLRGPADIGLLMDYLVSKVLPNLASIRLKQSQRQWQDKWSFDRFAEAANLPSPGKNGKSQPRAQPLTVFLPTNGVGLGHAKRCLLIAEQMTQEAQCSFAAFPSCVPMIRANGFPSLPLVQRSESHVEPYANDILNYRRLSSNLQKGDKLVFDGGHVYGSVYRTIVEQQLTAVWIRRGLWKPAHVHPAAFRREPIFDRVIVPLEAFDELNQDYSWGSEVHQVGPIVPEHRPDNAKLAILRDKVSRAFQMEPNRILVTMLGSGKATRREAHIHAICSQLEQRSNLMNLIVVWPGSTVPLNCYGWKNTRVIQTRDALSICLLADFVISACGYNSFHEVLYHCIPTIFIPQWTPTHDDQEKRSRAASDRGLAETVLASEMLRLTREIGLFLDEGKAAKIRAAISSHSFPSRGNSNAAQLIEGLGQ
jgi:hypothetical protein